MSDIQSKIRLNLLLLIAWLPLIHCGVPNFVEPEKPTQTNSQPQIPSPPPENPRKDPNNPPIIDPSLPNTPQVWTDQFIHDVPNGELDILLALHNKKKMSPYLDALKEQSTIFLSGLIDPPNTRTYGGKFSFRINVITSASAHLLDTDIVSENAFQGSINRLHRAIESLPMDWGETKNELFKQILDVSSGAYLRKGNSRFFLMMFSNSDDESSLDPSAVLTSLYSRKSKDLIHIYASFYHPASDTCNEFSYRRATRIQSLISLASGWSFELCNLAPQGADFINQTLARIYNQMSRKILTFKPRVDSLTVYHNGLEIEPKDWTYHTIQNEITINPLFSQLNLGDHVDVRYQTK